MHSAEKMPSVLSSSKTVFHLVDTEGECCVDPHYRICVHIFYLRVLRWEVIFSLVLIDSTAVFKKRMLLALPNTSTMPHLGCCLSKGKALNLFL